LGVNIKESDMPEANVIAEHMEVLGADGVHVGTVDHLDGTFKILGATPSPSPSLQLKRSVEQGVSLNPCARTALYSNTVPIETPRED
jgi:hypothetical protein